ncbi:hypothetical protein AVEN_144508-1 [Araneus ventricosus]|uniref:Uncharacterized protein n=1 Tax=Araneus ventricosus TaxID=182803 RepID=A0A4Y2L9K5_ARAVE|nr:hypothetical protein AVEN_144508-1 [Araneus ventricosus]
MIYVPETHQATTRHDNVKVGILTGRFRSRYFNLIMMIMNEHGHSFAESSWKHSNQFFGKEKKMKITRLGGEFVGVIGYAAFKSSEAVEGDRSFWVRKRHRHIRTVREWVSVAADQLLAVAFAFAVFIFLWCCAIFPCAEKNGIMRLALSRTSILQYILRSDCSAVMTDCRRQRML